jgi:3-methyladenine DNA glycosylase Mpg
MAAVNEARLFIVAHHWYIWAAYTSKVGWNIVSQLETPSLGVFLGGALLNETIVIKKITKKTTKTMSKTQNNGIAKL